MSFCDYTTVSETVTIYLTRFRFGYGNVMKTRNQTKPVSPEVARGAAKLSPVELAAKAGCALTTVYECEKHAVWPKHRALRAAYLAALGLTEEQVSP